MNSRTATLLDQLEGAIWFRNVGKPTTETVSQVFSWNAAVGSCATLEWENLCLEVANDYRSSILQKSWERLSRWNEIVREVKKRSIPLVSGKIEALVIEHQLPAVFAHTVDWDILHLAMAAEFSDIATSDFYAMQIRWYLDGRFPCGWDGAFPKGRCVVY